MTDQKLIVDFENGINRITINRPERRNAVDTETIKLLHDAIRESEANEVKVVVLTGSGEAFCAGADLQVRTPEEIRSYDVTEALRTSTNPTILAMRRLAKPIIARLHGPAAGVGCSLALACDIRIASDQAKLGQVFIKLGLMPDGGSTYFLPRMVGYGKAFELMAAGELIDAREALQLGLVNRVVPLPELDAAVSSIAVKLASAPSIALRKIKLALNYGEQADLAAALKFEAVNQAECFHSEDFLEGVEAFLAKRIPDFKGR